MAGNSRKVKVENSQHFGKGGRLGFSERDILSPHSQSGGMLIFYSQSGGMLIFYTHVSIHNTELYPLTAGPSTF